MQVPFLRSHEFGLEYVGSREQALLATLFEGPLWGVEIPEATLLACMQVSFLRPHEFGLEYVGSREQALPPRF